MATTGIRTALSVSEHLTNVDELPKSATSKCCSVPYKYLPNNRLPLDVTGKNVRQATKTSDRFPGVERNHSSSIRKFAIK